MGFRKLGLLLLVLLFQPLLLPAYPHYSLPNPFPRDFTREQNVGEKAMLKKLQAEVGVKREITVDRRGAGGGHGGGHGGRGASGGSGKARGYGDGPKTVIPLYAAGAMNQHHMYHSHHGANSGSLNYIGLNCLAFTFLVSMVVVYAT